MIMIAAPVQGVLTDRFSSAVVIASIPAFTVAYGLLYFLPNNLYVFYGFWIEIPLCAVGVWPLSYLRSTATWFDRRLGLSLGITDSEIGSGAWLSRPSLASWLQTMDGVTPMSSWPRLLW